MASGSVIDMTLKIAAPTDEMKLGSGDVGRTSLKTSQLYT